MARFDPVTKKFYCECSLDCDVETKNPFSRYASGHYFKSSEYRETREKWLVEYWSSTRGIERKIEIAEFFSGPQTPEHIENNRKAQLEVLGRFDESWYKKHSEAQSKKDISGSKNPNWKGGFWSYTGTGGYGWKALRESIWERDNYTCQRCGTMKDLCVHHVYYDTFREKSTELITLCCICNSEVNRDREIWIDFFEKRLGEITRRIK